MKILYVEGERKESSACDRASVESVFEFGIFLSVDDPFPSGFAFFCRQKCCFSIFLLCL